MPKYVYKRDFNNIVCGELNSQIPDTVTSMATSNDGLMIVDVAATSKEDLDATVAGCGYSYLFETTLNITNGVNWGELNEADVPFTNVNKGDSVYCLDLSKPLWFDGTNWADAVGNAVIQPS